MKEQATHAALLEKQHETSPHKLPYEKPRLGTVQLFAHQVLGSCQLEIPCTTIHPNSSVS
jgi:hypothetical protein